MGFKSFCLSTATCLGMTSSVSAAVISFDVAGTVADDGLLINAAFRGATFSGSIDVDSAAVTAQTGSFINYVVTGFDVDFVSGGGDVISFLGDGEEGEDSSALSVIPQTAGLNFFLYENIDNPVTQSLERRLLRLNFLADTAKPVSSLEELLVEDSNFGAASNFELGLLQFSTSQVPTSIAGATASTGAVAPSVIPLPAGGLLLLTGLVGIVGMKRRKSKPA